MKFRERSGRCRGRRSPWRCATDDVLESRMMLAFAPDGAEFRVNTYTANNQLNASVAADHGGNFVVAWESAVQDGNGFGIYAQRYRSDGRPAGTEFRVNTTTLGFQVNARVAMDADGDFVVVWQNHENDFESDIYARRYNAAGVPQSGEVVVNTVRGGDQARPAVAMAAEGSFVVVWDSSPQDGDGRGVIGRRYSAAGEALEGEFLVNTSTAGNQVSPAVGLDGSGGFVVAWKSLPASASQPTATFARQFNTAGTPRGNDFLVGSSPLGTAEFPALATSSDGSFLVAWGTYSNAAGVFSGDVLARRYRPDGTPSGAEFVANETIPGAQTQPAAAVDADGDVTIAWTTYAAATGERDVYARRFDAGGRALGGEFRVNTASEGIQTSPAVASEANGNCIIAWHSNTPNRTEFDVYAQRYRGAQPPVVTGVYLASSTWGQAFRSQLESAGIGSASFGFSVPAASQLKTMPWASLDQVSIRFSDPVSAETGHLAVRGSVVSTYPVASFAYDPATHTATWTLGRRIQADKVMLDLDADADGVSAGGVLLDGEWTGNANARDSFPSGDGAPGGDFRFRINVLPGDVNGDRAVDTFDVLGVRRESRKIDSHSPAYDINGDTKISQLDQILLRRALLTRLPAAEPATALVAANSRAAVLRKLSSDVSG